MTLPLIYTLNNCDRSTKSKIISIFKNANKKKNEVQYIIDTVEQAGGIVYATKKMNEYKNEALAILDNFENGEAKTNMKKLVDYITDRTY